MSYDTGVIYIFKGLDCVYHLCKVEKKPVRSRGCGVTSVWPLLNTACLTIFCGVSGFTLITCGKQRFRLICMTRSRVCTRQRRMRQRSKYFAVGEEGLGGKSGCGCVRAYEIRDAVVDWLWVPAANKESHIPQ
jgi:hypothetical protein